MSNLNGRKIKYTALHTTIFVPPPSAGAKGIGNLPDKLLSGPVTAVKGSGFDMTLVDDGVYCVAANGQEFLLPLSQCQLVLLESDKK